MANKNLSNLLSKKDIKYMSDKRDEFLCDVFLYFSKPPEEVLKIVSKFPDYHLRKVQKEKFIERSLWDKIKGKDKFVIENYEEHYFIHPLFKEEFRDERLQIELEEPFKFFTGDSPIAKLFGIEIDESSREVPFLEKINFLPLSTFSNMFYGLNQADIIIEFYKKMEPLLLENGLDYFGFAQVGGTDDEKMHKIIEKLEDQYDIWGKPENYSTIFMSSNKKFLEEVDKKSITTNFNLLKS